MIGDSQHETDIWNAFRQGDQDAYARIYELYFSSLYSYGQRFVSDQTQVEDAIQDLFVNLWRSRERLSPVDNIKFYLFRSLRRDLHRLTEKTKRLEEVDFENFLFTGQHPAEDFASLHTDEELAQKLKEILQTLPKRQLEAITLRFYDNFSIEEIASMMEVSEKTVRNTLHNSMLLLRRSSRLFYTLIELMLICICQ